MTTFLIVLLVAVLLFAVFFGIEYINASKRRKKLIIEANKAFGQFSAKRFSVAEMENIKKLFYRYRTDDSIDDITASDLDIDEFFNIFNICLSSPGKEYFYSLLRTPEFDEKKLSEFEKKVSVFIEDEALRNRFRSFFLTIGNMKRVNFFECIDFFDEVRPNRCIKDIVCNILLIASGGVIFFAPTPGIFILVCTLIYNIADYYKERGEIDSYVICFAYIAGFIKSASALSREKCDELSADLEKIRVRCQELKRFCNGVSTLGSNNSTTGAGNPLEILMDYARMVFHIDIIRFYRMLGILQTNKEKIEELYVTLGRIESYINVASIRLAADSYCLPESSQDTLTATNIYHPLIEDPVKNSIVSNKGILITGSNASGKSTFLKTVALNALFAKTIHMCFADEFSMPDYHVFSSMSLRDNLSENDSYFMVEIKALKRIFDYNEKYPDKKILCFVDEVLRGTNTVERIAAATQILKTLQKKGIRTFAATHDIELSELCREYFDNYHFDEDIENNDVLFNYLLKPGKATSKNAIKLLSILGFSKEIVTNAKELADNFTAKGVWE